MPIPFPGMNPYLEHPDLWPEVHQKLMAALAETLQTQLPPVYQVMLREHYYHVSGEDSLVVGSPGLNWGHGGTASPAETRTPIPIQKDTHHPPAPSSAYASTIFQHSPASPQVATDTHHPNQPSEPLHNASVCPTETVVPPQPNRGPIAVLVPVPQKIHETYLEILNAEGEVVTVIEALSPKKKRPGRGRTLYERQREAIFGSRSHFVEIDLLRGWEPPSIYGPDESGDYRMLISRSEQRPRADLYTWNVMETIPTIAIPLTGHDEVLIELKAVVDKACDRTDLLVNYQQNPLPPLRHSENLWLDGFLQEVGMRPYVS